MNMKKAIFILILCLASSRVFSQTGETITEEKSSEWVAVVMAPPAGPRATPARRNRPRPTGISTRKKEVPPLPVQQAPTDAFSKTNNAVKRFKKTKDR